MEFAQYSQEFGCARLTRDDAGVLEVSLHTAGGALVWGEQVHRELPELFARIGSDPDIRVVILTGCGEAFCIEADASILRVLKQPGGWDRITAEGTAILENLLRIEVPMIAAVNGPASVHAELALLCDAVLARPDTYFQDRVHATIGIVPGDGVQVIWPLLLGPGRGRYFLLTGQKIGAAEALTLGIAHEILAAGELLPRARELAADWASRPPEMMRYTRRLLTARLKRELQAELTQGFALEGLAMAQRRDRAAR
ncbi:MAG TPA: enoyl-CoA hydratase/isomerase family protein [Pseudonocardia sp.]|jgi:enoyl-CoA hydratase/carnithine racemase